VLHPVPLFHLVCSRGEAKIGIEIKLSVLPVDLFRNEYYARRGLVLLIRPNYHFFLDMVDGAAKTPVAAFSSFLLLRL